MRIPLIAILFVLPLAAAQGHEHGEAGPTIIATDLGPDMIAHVGSPVHFALIALGDDLDPDFHQDLPVRVTLNGVTLWETTAVSGHDYDGINVLDVVFPVAGEWEVALMDGGQVAHAINGTAIEVPLRTVELLVEAPTQVAVGEMALFQHELVDGGRVNHTDTLVEIFRDGELWFRTQTHTHTELQEMRYAFTELGTYAVRFTGFTAFPSSAQTVLPVVVEKTITVTPALGRTPAPFVSAPAAAKNVVIHGEADAPFQLIGTFDPYTVVGPRTIQHLSAMVIDPETRMPVQHVDFEATLLGPNGFVFASETLHEYDGIFELALRSAELGTHTLMVTATRGDWKGEMVMQYTVAPPVQANIVGPQTVSMTHSQAETGSRFGADIHIVGLGNQPFAHGEIEFELRGPDGQALIRNKLHTHGDGHFPFFATVAEAGEHQMRLSPFPLDPQPVTGFSRFVFPLDATEGTGIPTVAVPVEPVSDAKSPGAPVALILLGLALLARRSL